MVNKRGRPTLYTEALADEILKRHAAGESLTKICDEPGMPDTNTLKIGRHTSELQSQAYLVCRLLLEKNKTKTHTTKQIFTHI